MPESLTNIRLCKICGKRRAKRVCPAVEGDICSICCGTEREVTLTCPLKCEYLTEAHQREAPIDVPQTEMAAPDVVVSESFLRDHEELVLFLAYALVEGATRTPGAVDTDVIDALKALIKTQRTSDSGLYYETWAENLIAAAVQREFLRLLAGYQGLRQERHGLPPVRGAEILGVLVFLLRVGQQNQNGKPKGRMYLDLLHRMRPNPRVEKPAPSILL